MLSPLDLYVYILAIIRIRTFVFRFCELLCKRVASSPFFRIYIQKLVSLEQMPSLTLLSRNITFDLTLIT